MNNQINKELAKLPPSPLCKIGINFRPGYTRLNFSLRGISDVPLINLFSITAV